MAGPSQAWLAQAYGLLENDPFAAGAAQQGIAPPTQVAPPPPAPPLSTVASALAGPLLDKFDPRRLGAPPPAPTLMDGGNSASTDEMPVRVPGVEPAPELPPAGPPAPPPAPGVPTSEPQGPLPNDVQTMQVSRGGVAPAREVPLRGPQQNQHLMQSFEAPLAAADRVEARSQEQAQREASVFEEEARVALGRKEAMDRVAVQRADEMRAMQADYEEHIQSLGKATLDGGRVWGNASTGDKIGATVMLFLGGLFGGDDNKVEQALNKRIDEDIEQQKFDYMRGLDIARGKQTAFGMAMDRYRNEDAAWAAARAASLDYTMAKVHEKAAEGRGVDAANQADMLRAKLLAERERTIAEGLKYVQPSVIAPRYKQFIRGQELPGTVTETEARQNVIKHGVGPAERTDEILTKGGVDLASKRVELASKRAEKTDDQAKDISHEVTKAGITKLRALAENALTKLNESPSSAPESVVRGVASTAPFGIGDAAATAVFSDKANDRERTWLAFMNQNFHELSGAAISKSEEARMKAALGGSDPALRKAALAELLGSLDAAEQGIKGGHPLEAQEKYDRQRDAAKAGRPAAPEGVKKGW
ncbi:MAG: hypothetical protein KF894_08830 [Labilithrix sp.]|nr:hypothetical protein [Labilithrix sp.]